jgi:hypothetical protein
VTKYTVAGGAALAFVVGLAACAGEHAASGATTATKQTTPASDSTAAPAPLPTATATPSGSTAAAPRVARHPAPHLHRVDSINVPPPPAIGDIPTGATVVMRADQRVCTNVDTLEEHVTARVAEPVSGTNHVVLPVGATVGMRLSALRASTHRRDPITIGFEIQSVAFGGHHYAMSGLITRQRIDSVRGGPVPLWTRDASNSDTLSRGALRKVALDGCLPKGSRMTVQLLAPIRVR